LQFARDSLNATPQRLAYFGHSLGSAVASELAIRAAPQALILQAPFTSARAMAQRMLVPGLSFFWRAIARVHFDTRAVVAQLPVPVWVTHGDRDIVIPARMGRDVFAAARVKGELLIVPGAGHNDVAEQGGAAYWSWLRRALTAQGATPLAPPP
jgi:pimeloyl-ACP methyl ester carboxylesterase